jgi:hypothetical protein
LVIGDQNAFLGNVSASWLIVGASTMMATFFWQDKSATKAVMNKIRLPIE